MSQLYRSFNNYLKEIFGERVYRVPLDAGFTCPNRDGVRAFGGCTFCDDRGSGAPTISTDLAMKEQLLSGIERIRGRYKAKKFLAYFQAFSNTYAPEAVLRNLYESSLDHPDVVGLMIGTRPDCVPDNVLDMLAEFSKRTFVYLELGLQSANNQTLENINRGHSAEEFFDAVTRAKARGLNVATHLIFGLPGDDEAQMMSTVKQVATCGVDAIKIHQLVIFKGTPMEDDWKAGRLTFMDEDVYAKLVADSLEMLPPEMIVMRLVAEGTKDEVIGPTWSLDKRQTMEKIEAVLRERGTLQGSKFSSHELAKLSR
ncbi:MAG: TIGR01212 family radical SAM protein [Candidatus Obscuribacterales bacterium]|nr:TIGR01212 family radical SAM protein [Candidatus Obscuribacterales bacterium]